MYQNDLTYMLHTVAIRTLMYKHTKATSSRFGFLVEEVFAGIDHMHLFPQNLLLQEMAERSPRKQRKVEHNNIAYIKKDNKCQQYVEEKCLADVAQRKIGNYIVNIGILLKEEPQYVSAIKL